MLASRLVAGGPIRPIRMIATWAGIVTLTDPRTLRLNDFGARGIQNVIVVAWAVIPRLLNDLSRSLDGDGPLPASCLEPFDGVLHRQEVGLLQHACVCWAVEALGVDVPEERHEAGFNVPEEEREDFCVHVYHAVTYTVIVPGDWVEVTTEPSFEIP